MATPLNNEQLNAEIDDKLPTNHVKYITAVIMRALLKKFVQRLPISTTANLVAGVEKEIVHNFEIEPNNVTVWQPVGGGVNVLLQTVTITTKAADATTKVYITSPVDITGAIIKISP